MRHQTFRTDSYEFTNYAEMTDLESREIWEMRNHPEVARWMVNTNQIPWEDHRKFVENLRRRDDKDYFLIKDFSGNIVGSVNIDYPDKGYSERGIFINPKCFHRNHAFLSLTEFYRHAGKTWGIKGIETKVKTDNAPSNRLEEKLHACLHRTVEGYNIYQLTF